MAFNPDKAVKILQQMHNADDSGVLRAARAFLNYLNANGTHPSELTFMDTDDLGLRDRVSGVNQYNLDKMNEYYNEAQSLKEDVRKHKELEKRLRAEIKTLKAAINDQSAHKPDDDLEKIISQLQGATAELKLKTGRSHEFEKKIAELQASEASAIERAASLERDYKRSQDSIAKNERFREYLAKFVTPRIIDICDHQSTHDNLVGEPNWARR